MVIFGYEIVKFARDQVRISNANAMSRTLMYLHMTEGQLPPSGSDFNVSQHLYDRRLMDKVMRDPVFTSATVILDQYAFMLVNLYENVVRTTDLDKAERIVNDMKDRFSTIFADDPQNTNEHLERLRALITDENVQNNLSELRAIMDMNDDELRELKPLLTDADLQRNIREIKELASQPIPPECVIVYSAHSPTGVYEISVKLESRFLQSKMTQDGGNDDHRLEIGNNLSLNTAVAVYGSKVRAVGRNVSIIR